MGRSVERSLKLRSRLRLRACLAVLPAVSACLATAPAWGAQATLVADAHVNSAVPAANSGAISNLDVGGGYTALLQFDLSQLPAGTTAAQVSHAVLRVYANRVTTPGLLALAPVTAAWSEYGVTFATEPTVGGAVGTFSVSQAGAFIAVDVTSLVQGWIGNPATNNGISLSAATAIVQFDSKENDQTAHAATLDVELANTGPAGPAGATGLTGAAGISGLKGATGATGPAGPLGTTGFPGATGPQGVAGANGTPGPAGPMGPIGLSGATGPQGPAGTSGGLGTTGLVYQGNYSSVQNYAQGDVVLWQGTSYTSLIRLESWQHPKFQSAAVGSALGTGASGANGRDRCARRGWATRSAGNHGAKRATRAARPARDCRTGRRAGNSRHDRRNGVERADGAAGNRGAGGAWVPGRLLVHGELRVGGWRFI